MKARISAPAWEHSFLRHIERTRLLVHLVDVSDASGRPDPVADFKVINKELASFTGSTAPKEYDPFADESEDSGEPDHPLAHKTMIVCRKTFTSLRTPLSPGRSSLLGIQFFMRQRLKWFILIIWG